MLDIRLIRENPDQVRERLRGRGGDHWQAIDQVLELDTRRRAAETERQSLQAERNRLSKEIGIGRKQGQDTGDLEAQIRGSQHAWDIRLISAEALLRLLAITEEVEDPGVSERIRSILIPRE